MVDRSGPGELDWREEHAYTLGVQAFVYGFPWIHLASLRYLWTNVPRDPERSPYAALNQFWHARQIADASYRDGGSPNQDVLYSIAWLDVGKEPIILTHPDMGERYFAFLMSGMDSDNFAYVGKRTTGSAAGSFAVIGPCWDGTLPADVKALPASRTAAVLIMGRTLIGGPADLPAVTVLQDQYRLTPMSRWGSDEPAPEDRNVWPPFADEGDPLAPWKTMNKAMAENPPGRHSDIIDSWAEIGLGPGLDVDALDDATKRGLARAAVRGRELIGLAMSGRGMVRNGWIFPPASIGRSGDSGDFLTRAAVQCLGAIVADDPAEAIISLTFVDSSGDALTGDNAYEIRFGAGEQPPGRAFWSLTLYGLDTNFVDNPINRYAIGDRTPDLTYDDDGGLTLKIQSTPPATGDSNWLPCPQTGPYFLVLRLNLPSDEAINGSWSPPPVQRLT